MRIIEDNSYVNQQLVEKGFVTKVFYQIRLDRFFTPLEQEENAAFAKSHSRTEWENRCDTTREKIASENVGLMEFLEQHFKLGQYKTPYDDNYDFWFWCNDLFYTTSKRMNGRDYSYITLSVKDKTDTERNSKLLQRMVELLSDYPAKNIQAIIQYAQIENKETVIAEAERITSSCQGKFVQYLHYTGKLLNHEGEYYFMKKYAKTHGYKLKPLDVCTKIAISI